jgi:hypothetical protein
VPIARIDRPAAKRRGTSSRSSNEMQRLARLGGCLLTPPESCRNSLIDAGSWLSCRAIFRSDSPCGPTPAPVGVGITPKSSSNTSSSCSFSKVLQGPLEAKFVIAVTPIRAARRHFVRICRPLGAALAHCANKAGVSGFRISRGQQGNDLTTCSVVDAAEQL